MSDLFTRNIPVYYEVLRVAFQRVAGTIQAIADIVLRNADGQPIDDDRPTVEVAGGLSVTLAEGEHQDVNQATPIIVLIDGPVRITAGAGGASLKSGFRAALVQWYTESMEAYEDYTESIDTRLIEWSPPE